MHYRVFVPSIALSLTLICSLPSLGQTDFSNNELLRLSTDPASRTTNDVTPNSLLGISGTVQTQDGHPASNAKIDIRNIGSGNTVATGYTGPSGTFTVDGIPQGDYEVVASSGLAEAREQVRMYGVSSQVNLRLPHTVGSPVPQGQQSVSVRQMLVPEKAQDALKKAQNFASKGEIQEARTQIDKALKVDPSYSDAIAFRGIMDLQSGNLDAAGENLQKAIELDNNNGMAYIAMGSVYNARDQFDNAERELERGVTLSPNAWQGHFELAKTGLGKKEYESALKEIDRARDLVGTDLGLIHGLKGQIFLATKRYSEAVTEFEKFLANEKDQATAAQVQKVLEYAKASAAASK